MMKNIKKFKTQSFNSSINSAIDRAKNYLNKVKNLEASGKQLIAQTKKLPAAVDTVHEFSAEIENSVKKWRAKTAPNIEKIQVLVKKIKKEEN